LVASEEHFYDNGYKNLVEFQNEAGAIIRIYALNSHNTFSITADAFTAAATVAEGDIVEAAASTKMKIVAKATGLTSGSTQIGTVVKIETVGTLTYYVIQVV
jgi:K+-transporting ATPase c subunit